MKRGGVLLVLVTATIILSTTFFSIDASAGQAGVGVLNVAPKYGVIRVVLQDNFIRIYLTVSDYNSWEDIHTVSVILEDYGVETTEFLFKQWEDATSYKDINEFSESSGEKNLLVKEKCSYQHSDKKETIDEKCNLDLLFVFQITWFTCINVIVSDREGLTATTQIDYSTEEIMRSNNILMIPGVHEPITVTIPPYLLTLIAVIIGVFGTLLFVKKKEKIKRVAYEKE